MNENQNNNLNMNPEQPQPANLSMHEQIMQNSAKNGMIKNDNLESFCDYKCPKCGFGVSSEATICLHCGYTVKEITGAVAKDNVILERAKEKKFTGIIITNIILTALLIAVFIYKEQIPYINSYLDYEFMEYITLTIYIPSVVVSMFYLTCYQMLLHKANLPWWGVFIPIYNICEFFDLCTSSQFFLLWNAVPAAIWYIGYRLYIPYYPLGVLLAVLLIYISTYSQLASRFDANKILMILFPGIYMPIVAINKNFQIE